MEVLPGGRMIKGRMTNDDWATFTTAKSDFHFNAILSEKVVDHTWFLAASPISLSESVKAT